MGPAVGAHPVVVVFVPWAVDGAAVLGIGTPILELTGVADLSFGTVHSSPSAAVVRAPVQALSGRADIDVPLGIVTEMAGAKKPVSRKSKLGIATYARMPILSRAATFSRVPYLASPVTWWGELAPEGSPPEQQVEHGPVLGHLRGGNQSVEDDPGLTPVHDVVDLG